MDNPLVMRPPADHKIRSTATSRAGSRTRFTTSSFPVVNQRVAADRYEALVRDERAARAAGAQAALEIQGWIIDHPIRARLHRLGLKDGHLTEREGRIAAAEKARTALDADPEGKRAYEAREAVRKAQETAQREIERLEREQQARHWAERAKANGKSKGRDDFGIGLG